MYIGILYCIYPISTMRWFMAVYIRHECNANNMYNRTDTPEYVRNTNNPIRNLINGKKWYSYKKYHGPNTDANYRHTEKTAIYIPKHR